MQTSTGIYIVCHTVILVWEIHNIAVNISAIIWASLGILVPSKSCFPVCASLCMRVCSCVYMCVYVCLYECVSVSVCVSVCVRKQNLFPLNLFPLDIIKGFLWLKRGVTISIKVTGKDSRESGLDYLKEKSKHFILYQLQTFLFAFRSQYF